MSDSALDIFIPYWGDPAYMRLTVDSVLHQSDPRWFLTVVDDAYPDPTIEDYIQSLGDPRITYIKKQKNEGITANFRTSVTMARHKLVAVVGCDDILLPNYVETILEAHEQYPGADIIQPGVRVINDQGQTVKTLVDTVKQRVLRPRLSKPVLLSGESLATSLLHGDWLYWPSLAFKTTSIRAVDFRDDFAIIQDLALIMDMILQGRSLLVVPGESFAYRRHTESASSLLIRDGSRFEGERDYFTLAAGLARSRRWRRAEIAARLRITSRLHALSLLPYSVKSRNLKTLGTMIRHGLGT
jgi:glycosyltransferase involved in cell wall biosynthesis